MYFDRRTVEVVIGDYTAIDVIDPENIEIRDPSTYPRNRRRKALELRKILMEMKENPPLSYDDLRELALLAIVEPDSTEVLKKLSEKIPVPTNDRGLIYRPTHRIRGS